MSLCNEQSKQAFELFDKGLLNEAEALYNNCIERLYAREPKWK